MSEDVAPYHSDDPRPCPFCGSKNMITGLWNLDSGEVDAIECSHCYAGAPASIWNRRTDDEENNNG